MGYGNNFAGLITKPRKETISSGEVLTAALLIAGSIFNVARMKSVDLNFDWTAGDSTAITAVIYTGATRADCNKPVGNITSIQGSNTFSDGIFIFPDAGNLKDYLLKVKLDHSTNYMKVEIRDAAAGTGTLDKLVATMG